MAVTEPVLNVDEIQGNILAGFNKDHQSFLFLRIKPAAADVTAARQWIKTTLAPLISHTGEVLAFNRLFKEAKAAGNPLPQATWVNAGFSASCIGRILSAADVAAFGDEAFTRGLAQRSEFIGDPTNPAAEGNKRNWKFGGRPENEADIVVIVASDDGALRQGVVDTLLATLAAGHLDLVFQQDGRTLPSPWTGHEHFGFKDGVSQPGVRGRASAAADDFLTPRRIDPADPRSEYFGKPGQLLLWPGEFIFGTARQPQSPLTVTTAAGDTASDFPAWARDGSYLVIRRLRQDFGAFWDFANQKAIEEGMTPVQFATLLVGRWPSGAPLMRVSAENATLGADELANNYFAFNRDSVKVPVPGYTGDTYPQATADFLGKVCPHFAHIRKVNPRDGATDLGVAQDTAIRSLLRRGIPYGDTLLGVATPTPVQLAADRGLVFASYQASIVNQFETILRRWANEPNLPTPGGHDPVIGQEETHADGRRRFINLPSGKKCVLDKEWVIPTGGGYFFAPSRTAVRDTLGA